MYDIGNGFARDGTITNRFGASTLGEYFFVGGFMTLIFVWPMWILAEMLQRLSSRFLELSANLSVCEDLRRLLQPVKCGAATPPKPHQSASVGVIALLIGTFISLLDFVPKSCKFHVIEFSNP